MYELQSTFGRDNSFSGLKCRSREIIYFDSFANGDLPFIPAEEIEQRNGRNDSALCGISTAQRHKTNSAY
jgi:hypothetical protein